MQTNLVSSKDHLLHLHVLLLLSILKRDLTQVLRKLN